MIKRLLLILFFLILSTNVLAREVTLQWDHSDSYYIHNNEFEGDTNVDPDTNIITLQSIAPDEGTLVRLIEIDEDAVLPEGLVENYNYYIRDNAGNDCKLSTTDSDDDIVDITGLGSDTLAITYNELLGYIVYWGTASRTYANSVNIGLFTAYSIAIPDNGLTYFFAVTSVNQKGLESDFSNEVNTYVFKHTYKFYITIPSSKFIIIAPSGRELKNL
jgi:hypothetical protein